MTKEKIPQIKAKPVFSVEAEAAVLGSLILKNELFDEISKLSLKVLCICYNAAKPSIF